MRWETVERCTFCGGAKTTGYLSSYVPDWYEQRPLSLVKCTACSLVRASPRPNAQDLYVNYIAGGEKAREINVRKLARQNVLLHHSRAIKTAAGFARTEVKSLFDIGCGAGTLMMAARSLGLEAEGNDLNKAAIDNLKSMGFNAHLGFSQDLHLSRSYDMVMNLDYLEHSYTPSADLAMNFKILNPGGVLYLKTLYLGCPDHVAHNEAWGLFGNGHFHYFFPETLEQMVKKVGFEIVHLETKGLIVVVAVKPGGTRRAAA